MITLTFPTELRRQLERSAKRLETERRDLLEILGIQLLSLAQQDYLNKSKGGTGKDGIAWKGLKESTIKAKTQSRRAKRQAKKARTGPKSRLGSKKRPAGSATMIGVDLGLQRASASPGFDGAPEDIAFGFPPRGGNVFEIRGDEFTAGYGRTYSEFFDEERQLLPDDLPPAYQKPLEEQIVDWGERILEKELR